MPRPLQYPDQSSEVQRVQQATVVHDFVQRLRRAPAATDVVVLGDLNDYQFSPALQTLSGSGGHLTDLIATLPANQRYTYVFNGESQVLDHILITSGFSSTRTRSCTSTRSSATRRATTIRRSCASPRNFALLRGGRCSLR